MYYFLKVNNDSLGDERAIVTFKMVMFVNVHDLVSFLELRPVTLDAFE